jgi:hypothetical protein
MACRHCHGVMDNCAGLIGRAQQQILLDSVRENKLRRRSWVALNNIVTIEASPRN